MTHAENNHRGNVEAKAVSLNKQHGNRATQKGDHACDPRIKAMPKAHFNDPPNHLEWPLESRQHHRQGRIIELDLKPVNPQQRCRGKNQILKPAGAAKHYQGEAL